MLTTCPTVSPASSPDDRAPVAAQVPASSSHRGDEGGRLRGLLPLGQSSDLRLPGDPVHRRHGLSERRRESSPPHHFSQKQYVLDTHGSFYTNEDPTRFIQLLHLN